MTTMLAADKNKYLSLENTASPAGRVTWFGPIEFIGTTDDAPGPNRRIRQIY